MKLIKMLTLPLLVAPTLTLADASKIYDSIPPGVGSNVAVFTMDVNTFGSNKYLTVAEF